MSQGPACAQRRALCLALAGVGLVAPACAQALAAPPPPGARDLCPVCGMMVSKYPHWVATIVWKDGHSHHFDGPKDLFKALLNLGKFIPGHRSEDVAGVFVTEFYGLKRIDARKAWFVQGSDVLGPMGNELVPLASAEDAADFRKDHKGRQILHFDQVTPALIQSLDAAKP